MLKKLIISFVLFMCFEIFSYENSFSQNFTTFKDAMKYNVYFKSNPPATNRAGSAVPRSDNNQSVSKIGNRRPPPDIPREPEIGTRRSPLPRMD